MNQRCLLAATLFLASCTTINTLNQRGTLILKPQISTYQSQTTIIPYSKSSIDHLILKLYTYDGTEHDQSIQKTLLNAQLDNPLVFSNLRPNTTYRIRAYAYATSNETTLISDNALSYSDVTLVQDDRPTLNNIPVRLIDRDFNGQATGTIAVTPGGYTLPGGEIFSLTHSIVTTLAGSLGTSGSQDGVGNTARFQDPIGVALDSSGNLFVADRTNHSIRKVTMNGTVTTLAGGMGTSGSVDGVGGNARFIAPYGIAADSAGNVYVADNQNHAVRKVTQAGVVTTFAGMMGASGSIDGTGTAARFYYLLGVAVDATGNVYVADEFNHSIRKITPARAVSTLAGLSGSSGKLDGTGTNARFQGPVGVTVDAAGNVYVVDRGNHAIRKVTPAGVVTTLAGALATSGRLDGVGSNARFASPYGITVDPVGNLYVGDTGNHAIRKITPAGVVTTLIGALGTTGGVDGTGNAVRFNGPYGVAIDSAGNLYVGDRYNHSIRVVQY